MEHRVLTLLLMVARCRQVVWTTPFVVGIFGMITLLCKSMVLVESASVHSAFQASVFQLVFRLVSPFLLASQLSLVKRSSSDEQILPSSSKLNLSERTSDTSLQTSQDTGSKRFLWFSQLNESFSAISMSSSFFDYLLLFLSDYIINDSRIQQAHSFDSRSHTIISVELFSDHSLQS